MGGEAICDTKIVEGDILPRVKTTEEKIEDAKKYLGEKYVGHVANRVKKWEKKSVL